MIKNMFKFILPVLLLLGCFLQAEAAIMSEYDISFKKGQLQELAQYDYISFINKNELIGYRLDGFNMATSQYKNAVMITLERLNKNLAQIEIINNSTDFSDSDKQVQLNNIYQDSDAALYDLDSKSINYVFSLKNTMPSITFNRFAKRFIEFYNSFQLTNSQLSIR